MAHFTRLPLLLTGVAALLLAGCSDGEEAQQEADDAAIEQAEESSERAPAVSAEPKAVPAPENVAEPPSNAQKTQNGVAYIVLEDADGDVHPTARDTVTVHYSGWTTDGKMFDSSVARGEPATLPLGSLIPGWQEAVPLMTVGDKYRFWIPGKLAYDSSTRPGAPKGMLVFDIELIGINQPAEPEQQEQNPTDMDDASGDNA